MDLSNFDFDALDHATRDETLACLSYPVVPDFEVDPSRPIEPLDNAWHETDWQSDWQSDPAADQLATAQRPCPRIQQAPGRFVSKKKRTLANQGVLGAADQPIFRVKPTPQQC